MEQFVKQIENIKSLELKNIGLWPLGYKVAIIIIFCALCIMLLWCGYGKEHLESIYSLNKEKKVIAKNIDYLQNQLDSHVKFNKSSDLKINDPKTKNKILQLIPNISEISNFIGQMSNLIKITNLNLIKMQLQEEQLQQNYSLYPVDIILVGGYSDIICFFEKLKSFPRLINVTKVTLTKSSKTNYMKGNMLTVKCLMEIYQFAN